MDCFVIGGTGTVGASLVRRLAALGHCVRVGTRRPEHVGKLPAQARAVVFDLDLVRDADFVGVDRVFCMVPRGVASTPERGAQLFLTLRRAGVAHVVLMTGLGVDKAVGSPMQRFEASLRESRLPHTIVRPNYIFHNFCAGPLREGIVRRDEIAVAVGDARVAFVDARDIAEVAAAALIDDVWAGRAFDLTGPSAVSHAEIAAAIARAVQRPILFRALSDAEARIELAAAGLPPERIEARLSFLAIARRGLLAEVSPDVQTVLGRAPRSLHTFATDHASDWLKESP